MGAIYYGYIDSWDYYNDTSLPPKEQFLKTFSRLKNKQITDVDYKNAQRVYCMNSIKKLGKYNDVYYVIYYIQLIDCKEHCKMYVYGKFKVNHLSFIMLPSSSSSSSSSSWKAALKTTSIKLGLITEINMILLYEKGVKGGVTTAICHYVEASNKYMHGCNE